MPKSNPKEGEYWAKYILRIADSCPLDILELPEGAPQIPLEIFVMPLNDFRQKIAEPKYFDSKLFRAGTLKIAENEFLSIKQAVFVDGTSGKLVVFHGIDQKGNPTGIKVTLPKDEFLKRYPAFCGMHPRYDNNKG